MVLAVGFVVMSPVKAYAAVPEVRTPFVQGIDVSGPLVTSGSALVFGTHRSTNAGSTWASDASLVAPSWTSFTNGQLVGYTSATANGVTTYSVVTYAVSSGATQTYAVPSRPFATGGTWALEYYLGVTVPLYNFVTGANVAAASPTGPTLSSGPSADLTPTGLVLWRGWTSDNHSLFATAASPTAAPSAWATIDGILNTNTWVATDTDLRYVLDSDSGLQLCTRPLSSLATAPTCLVAWPGSSAGYSTSYAYLYDFGATTLVSMIRIKADGSAEYRAFVWNGSTVVDIQVPPGSSFSQPGNSEGDTPYAVIRDAEGVPTLRRVNLDGSLSSATAALPLSPSKPWLLAVAPDRMVGADPRDGSNQFATVWSRSVSGSGVGPESVLPQRASSIWAFAGRTAVGGPNGLSMYDRGSLGYTFAGASLTQLSGPYVLQDITDSNGSFVGERISTADGVQVATFPTGGQLFGSRFISDSTDNAGVMRLVINDLTGKSAAQTVTLPGDRSGCWNVQVWYDNVAMTCDTSTSRDISIFSLKTGALVKNDTGKTLVDLGDGYYTFRTYGGDFAVQVAPISAGSPVVLTDCSDSAQTDGIGHVVCTSVTESIWRDFSSWSTSAPRLAGIIAPAMVDFSASSSWVPQLDLTKAVNAGTLVIKNAAGTVVRSLATAASADGSIRGVSWDGKDASAKAVPVGTYSYTLNATAADGTGAVVGIDGVAAAGGTVVVSDTYGGFQSFVKAAYQDFLGRAPSATELAAKAGALTAGTLSKEAFLSSMANSDEWLNAIVTKMYLDTLGRAPDAAGLAGWTTFLRNKTFTVADVASRFYASDEYYLYHAGGTPTSWVTALYQKLLNRAPDAAGLAAWVANTTSPAWGRARVAFEFYQSLESRLKRVDALYQVLLGRGPDATGWPFWADVVRSTGDITLAISLANSEEYWLRAKARY